MDVLGGLGTAEDIEVRMTRKLELVIVSILVLVILVALTRQEIILNMVDSIRHSIIYDWRK